MTASRPAIAANPRGVGSNKSQHRTNITPLWVTQSHFWFRRYRRRRFRRRLRVTPITPSVEELPYRHRSWSFGNDLYNVRA